MYADVLLGLQWGDEGKGKIADLIAPNYDVIARFQGGPNAGHTLVVNDTKYVLHTIPSGIIHPGTKNLIGNGVVIDPVTLRKEIEILHENGIEVSSRLYISDKAHLIMPTHKALDAAYEKAKGGEKIGSTLKGIGPTYQDKASREGLRVGDLLSSKFESRVEHITALHEQLLNHMNYDGEIDFDEWYDAIAYLKKFKIVASEYWINEQMDNGAKVLAEGAQGTLLDIDFGTYPFVTSSNTVSASACSGLGIAPSRIRNVFGIMKAYTTRVGSGPFPTELTNSTGEALRKAGQEFGATTGRPRRCGWLDLEALRYAIMLNGVTELILTKVDVLSALEEIQVGQKHHYKNKEKPFAEIVNAQEELDTEVHYDVLPSWNESRVAIKDWQNMPQALSDYIKYLEKQLGCPFRIVSVGPARDATLFKEPVS